MKICKATKEDLPQILDLQYLAYQSEAEYLNNYNIPPLKQTLDELEEEFENKIILKAISDENKIIGSVRGNLQDNTVYIGKLMVHPDYRNIGLGSKLLLEIENYFPKSRYELFTSTQSAHNIRLYEEVGYVAFDQRKVDDKLTFVYLEKQ